jgi:methionyl-tRNA formyltransferase
MIRVIFFGSPGFAVPTLKALIADEEIEVVAVVTQPDKPAGRGKKLTPPPVKAIAEGAGVEIRQPRNIRGKKFAQWCADFEVDAFIVVAYGKILPARLIEMPRLGCINLHSSLLPKYRGAAPINWAMVHGEKITGTSTMLMDEGMDTGPILLQETTEISLEEDVAGLTDRLSISGAPLMIETIKKLNDGEISPQPQDHSQASHAPMISKEDGRIDWLKNALQIHNKWQGFTPWPGVFTSFRNETFKLKKVLPALDYQPQNPNIAPGTIEVENNRMFVACGDVHFIEILEGQLPGKKALPARDLINGKRIESGEKLG